jgi:multisubunit Na+/H+ antiporter MnhB subunit
MHENILIMMMMIMSILMMVIMANDGINKIIELISVCLLLPIGCLFVILGYWFLERWKPIQPMVQLLYGYPAYIWV